jgi:hypothetical protein
MRVPFQPAPDHSSWLKSIVEIRSSTCLCECVEVKAEHKNKNAKFLFSPAFVSILRLSQRVIRSPHLMPTDLNTNKRAERKGKNIQQRGFANGHPLNY